MHKTVTNLKGAAQQFTAIPRLLITLALLQGSGSLLAAETRTVIGDPTLSAGPIHRFLLGADYRDLWATPFDVEVLDLSTEAGGLTPLFRVGGAQTFGLALKGADGKSYTFRSLVKEQAQNLHEDLRDHAAGRIFQDQQASIHPAATSMVPPLAKAVGVMHNNPRLIILPDDPALGEFQELFAGRLGTIEEFPTKAEDGYEGFNGATDIIKSFELVTQWLASPEVRVDARAHLRLRLFDIFLGDWDRHANNYRWAKIPGNPAWQPIPEDRDQAFVDFQGVLLSLARPFETRLLRFEEEYPSSIGLTTQGWPIHRWFLAELDRSAWIEIATDMQSRITDDVIDEAVNLMPDEYKALSADKLARIMRARRDNLPKIAERIYQFMNAEVDVQATDQNDRIDLRNVEGGLEVTVGLDNGDEPYFRRTLNAKDTKSLRLYLRDGRNAVVCHGIGRTGIKIDVIGSDNNDLLEGCDAAKLRFTETAEIERRKTPLRVVPNPGETIGLPSLNVPPESDRPQDWRSSIVPNYIVRTDSDAGFVVGGGFTLNRFEFGKNPFGQSHTFTAGVSISGELEANYLGTYQHWDPRFRSSLAANITSIKEADFFGFGNDTSDEGDSDFFDTEQTVTTIKPSLDFVASPEVSLFGGVEFNYSSTEDDDESLLNELAPLGIGDFGWANVFVGIDYDTRDRSRLNSPGVHVRVEGGFSPETLDVEDSFNSIEAAAAGYFEVGSRSMVALRIGGRSVSSDAPFQEAAYIGGITNVRGLDNRRFAGDASAFGSAELRVSLGQASAYLAQAEYGVFFFSDVGRVFTDDIEVDDSVDSDDLHASAGAGISASALDDTFILSFAVARSEERTAAVFSAGFSF